MVLSDARDDLDLATAKGVNETVTAARALAVGLFPQNNYCQTRSNYEYVLYHLQLEAMQ
jgi:hypothetical protein